MSWWSEGEPESGWQAIMPEPVLLKWLVIGGNGKDLGLELALVNGPRLRMEASDVAVSTDGSVQMQLEQFDDVSLEIQYSGPGLEVRSLQVMCPDPDWEEEFTAATRAFIADGGELAYCVGVRIALAAIPGSPACHGDPQ
ncbi:MAG: hypothetical protein ACRDNS_11720 [Trebonia sp.]